MGTWHHDLLNFPENRPVSQTLNIAFHTAVLGLGTKMVVCYPETNVREFHPA